MSTATKSGGVDAHERVPTRRAMLAGGLAGAGALGAGLLAPRTADAQALPIDDRYVLRDRMPINVKDAPRGQNDPDDTNQVQNAINIARDRGGGTVFFPPGDYDVSGGLTIPAGKPIRLLGSGMTLNSDGASFFPTRLKRTRSGTLITAVGTGSNRVYFELSDIELRGGGFQGLLLDVQYGNTVQFHRVQFAGASDIGVRMRQVYNSSGSHLRFHACGAGTAKPACIFDAPPGDFGSNTVQWNNVEFEGNSGTDLKLTGDGSGNANSSLANEIQISQVKLEGGTAAAANCPYLDLDYSQNCKFSDVAIIVHGGRTVPPLRKSQPTAGGGTRADTFVNLNIDSTEGDNFPYGIEHFKSSLQLENVTILGAATAAIKINSTVGAKEFQLGKLVTNVARAVEDARNAIPTVTAATTLTPPRERLVGISGSSGSITSITPHEAGFVTTFKFAGGPTVVHGGNIHLAGSANFVAPAEGRLTLVTDGTGWYEVARSVP